MRRYFLRARVPLVALAVVAAAVTAAPLRAQTTTGPAVVQEVRVTIHRQEEPGSCSGGIDDWREELRGWVGMPGTRAAYKATQSYPTGSGDAAYYGIVWRTVHAALCRAKCPDGGCDGICRFTIEATGPAELSLSAEEEGARLGIHKSKRDTELKLGGGPCLDPHDDDAVFTLFDDYRIPDLGFIPGDVSMKQLKTGVTLPLMVLGDEQVGTLEVLSGCNNRDFDPGVDNACGTPKKAAVTKKKP